MGAARRASIVTAGVVALTIAAAIVGISAVRRWPARSPAVPGDPARGAKLYATLPCGSCHDITRPWPGGDVCPNLGNIATEADRIVRLPDYRGRAKDAAGYIRESIVDPDVYIVAGQNYRQDNGHSVMPKTFGQTLTAAQLDDLVAFLLTRR